MAASSGHGMFSSLTAAEKGALWEAHWILQPDWGSAHRGCRGLLSVQSLPSLGLGRPSARWFRGCLHPCVW